MQRFPAVPKCPRCNKSVYLAEQVIGPGGAWHKTCLKCASCNKKLDSTNLLDHNDEPYCRSCHTRLFGPKGYGFAGGAAGLSTDASVSASFVALSNSGGGERSPRFLPSSPHRLSRPSSPGLPSIPYLGRKSSASMIFSSSSVNLPSAGVDGTVSGGQIPQLPFLGSPGGGASSTAVGIAATSSHDSTTSRGGTRTPTRLETSALLSRSPVTVAATHSRTSSRDSTHSNDYYSFSAVAPSNMSPVQSFIGSSAALSPRHEPHARRGTLTTAIPPKLPSMSVVRPGSIVSNASAIVLPSQLAKHSSSESFVDESDSTFRRPQTPDGLNRSFANRSRTSSFNSSNAWIQPQSPQLLQHQHQQQQHPQASFASSSTDSASRIFTASSSDIAHRVTHNSDRSMIDTGASFDIGGPSILGGHSVPDEQTPPSIAARFQPGSTSAPSIYRINQGSTASVGSSPFSRFRTNSNAGGSSSSSSGISNSPARSFFQQQSQQFNDICPRCQKVVYHAEKVSSCGRTWHKHCLKCTDCNKGMTPGNVTDRNGDPYCARCYQKNFGPKGTGFAGGAAYLTAEGSAR